MLKKRVEGEEKERGRANVSVKERKGDSQPSATSASVCAVKLCIGIVCRVNCGSLEIVAHRKNTASLERDICAAQQCTTDLALVYKKDYQSCVIITHFSEGGRGRRRGIILKKLNMEHCVPCWCSE